MTDDEKVRSLYALLAAAEKQAKRDPSAVSRVIDLKRQVDAARRVMVTRGHIGRR